MASLATRRRIHAIFDLTADAQVAENLRQLAGAMYVSYALAAPILGLVTLLCWALLRWPLEWAYAAAVVVLLLCTPAIFRYSRIAWVHFDRWTEPED